MQHLLAVLRAELRMLPVCLCPENSVNKVASGMCSLVCTGSLYIF